jgi:hypothetical protein
MQSSRSQPPRDPSALFLNAACVAAMRRVEPRHRGRLEQLYRLWETWNDRFFAGRLTTPRIVFDRSGVSSRYGSCGPTSRPDALSRIRLRLSLLTGSHPKVRAGKKHAKSRFRLVAEVLLHEMVHQWQQEVVGDAVGDWCSHGAAFCQKCNEIGRQLRLLPVRIATDVSKDATLPSCAYWPHSARRKIVRCPVPRRGR